jgi:hypothetical protein
MIYCIHDDTGRILMSGHTTDEINYIKTMPGHHVVEGAEADRENDYVDDGVVLPRPACPAVLTGNELSNVPVPALLTINGKPYNTTEADITLAFPKPGAYKVVVEAWPYLDGTFEINI